MPAMNELHESNRACWNEWADWWRRKADQRGTWRKCHRDPTLVLSPGELSFLSEVRGQEVCVLGSGDNEVVFALAGMGAKVTSVDISERQLEVARERAGILGLDISFLRADVTDLASVPAVRFEVVYTGGHVSVWIADLRKYYGEAVRVLRPRGLFIVNEYHPIRRMWHESDGPTPRHRYFDRGPYEYRTDEGWPQIEFHWTVADHIQAVLDAGCALIKVDEYGEGKEEEDYAASVPATLPMSLLLVGRKVVLASRYGIGGGA
ncbi:MAG: class I SAM-dependent methyltransferase [Candidatus Latescibacteria bacterium]|nr:class I SAM-dependent methyltransferase [Candidatus Latescibacterota bacterium]